MFLAGAERYRAITTSHIRNAEGAILVYDINSEISFGALDFWLDCLKKASSEDLIVYLLGNKSDLAMEDRNLRRVSKEMALEFVNKHKIKDWTECSAKKNVNIKETFKSLYKAIYLQQKTKLEEKTVLKKKVIDSRTPDPKSKCC